MIAKQILLLPQASKRLLHPHRPKLTDDLVKHNWYVSQLGSTLCMWMRPTASLDGFTASSGNNSETKNQRNERFHIDRTKTM